MSEQRAKNLAFLQTHRFSCLRDTGHELEKLLSTATTPNFVCDQNGLPQWCSESPDFFYPDDDHRAAAMAAGCQVSCSLELEGEPFKLEELCPINPAWSAVCWPFHAMVTSAEQQIHLNGKNQAAETATASILLLPEFGLGQALATLASGVWQRRPRLLFFSERRIASWFSLIDFYDLEAIFAQFEQQDITVMLAPDFEGEDSIPIYQAQLNWLAQHLQVLRLSLGLVAPPQPDIVAACKHTLLRSGLLSPLGGFVEDDFLFCIHELDNASRANVADISFGSRYPVPTFVVGSGPSLDEAIPVLQKFKDIAIIISCGSAEEALLSYGILPDLTCHLENTVINPLLIRHSEREQTATIPLIASASVSPRMVAIYNKVMLAFRDTSPLQEIRSLQHFRLLGQNVGQLGISVAIKLGAWQVFLFGMDMASRHDQGHCRNIGFYQNARRPHKNDYRKTGQRIRANFGGTIEDLSNMQLWRTHFENSIAHLPVQIFNCSDGAYIAHTTPKLPSTLPLPEGADYREQVQKKAEAMTNHILPLFEKRHLRRHIAEEHWQGLGPAVKKRIAYWRHQWADLDYFQAPDPGGASEIAAIKDLLSGTQNLSAVEKCARKLVDRSITTSHLTLIWQKRASLRRSATEIQRLTEAFTIILDFIEDTLETLVEAIGNKLADSGHSLVERLEYPIIEDIVDGFIAYADHEGASIRQTLLNSFPTRIDPEQP